MATFQLHCVFAVLTSAILQHYNNSSSRYPKLTLFIQSSQKHHLDYRPQARSGHDPLTAQRLHITQCQNQMWPSSPNQLPLVAARQFPMIWVLGCLHWSYGLPVPSQSFSLCLKIAVSKILIRIRMNEDSRSTCVQQRHGNHHTAKIIWYFCILPT